MKSDELHDSSFIILESKRKFLKNIMKYLSGIKLLPAPVTKNRFRQTAGGYAIVPSLTMVRLGGKHQSENAHIIVYGTIVPPHPGVNVQITFQGHLDKIDKDACCNTKPVTTMTDRAGGFTFDENFNCGPGVKYITCVTTLLGVNSPDVIGSLPLHKEEKRFSRPHNDNKGAKDDLPAVSIRIEFETNCHKAVTYWFDHPFKSGTVSDTSEITYRPTENSILYLKLSSCKEDHPCIIDVFTTTDDIPSPRYQRIHSTGPDEEFMPVSIFDPDSTLRSALIQV